MKTSKQITIKTALHEGIYKSCGGGTTTTHYRYSIGPLNLLKAVKQLREHYNSMERSYGGIGHQGSWIEIDGTTILSDEIPVTLAEAKQLIADVGSGELRKTRRAIADDIDNYYREQDDRYYSEMQQESEDFWHDEDHFEDEDESEAEAEEPKSDYQINYKKMLDAVNSGHPGVKLSNSGNTVIFSDNTIGNRSDLSSIPHIAAAQLRHAGLV